MNKIEKTLKLQIPAGQATPASSIGPALGQQGVNIMSFCKDFNLKTRSKTCCCCCCIISCSLLLSVDIILWANTCPWEKEEGGTEVEVELETEENDSVDCRCCCCCCGGRCGGFRPPIILFAFVFLFLSLFALLLVVVVVVSDF